MLLNGGFMNLHSSRVFEWEKMPGEKNEKGIQSMKNIQNTFFFFCVFLID